MTRVIIVHGWGASPESDWHPWIKQELELKGYDVVIPEMPNTDMPDMNEWIPYLAETIGRSTKDTILVGHSIGCQTILRYLETKKTTTTFDGIVLVAPWTHLTREATEDPESLAVAKPWLEKPIDWDYIRNKARFISIFSDDDRHVPLSETKIFERMLNSEIRIEHEQGHFSQEEGIKYAPSVLEAIEKISYE